MSWRRWVGALGAALVALLAAASPAPAAFEDSGAAAQLLAAGPPAGFEESTVLDGLTLPTAVRFAPDGRIFVAEKGGTIKVFDDFGDPTPEVYADLSRQVHDYWDRGLLGLALDPQFETRPYVYVLYTYNKDPNTSEMPRWPDSCPERIEDGCTVMNRLSRLHGGVEEVLIEDWCQQHPSHAIGSLAFGDDGALYVSGGDGASFNIADWGQEGIPPNPCNDPPGRYQTPPTAEGGALRSQDIRTAGDPTGLSGTILRLDPDTALPMPGNPGTGSVNERRIVAYGLRNPFRIALRPGTDEIWVGDVGWREWEEINRIPNPTAAVRNFGWPCYEGAGRQGSYDALDVNICESLYAAGPAAEPPHFAYAHHALITPGEACGTGSSSTSGLAFTPAASSFPERYDGALFFADYSRRCIWAMLDANDDGVPDRTQVELFADDAAPAELQFGPNGDLYYVDIGGGTIRRIRSTTGNPAPVARATATPSSGPVPLTVAFDATASSDPGGGALEFEWDLDGDGQFDDSASPTPSRTYSTPGRVTARLRVRDADGLTDTRNLPITAGTPPAVAIASPAPGTTWAVGDKFALSGSATGSDGNPIPAGGLTWRLNLRHCDRITGSCHTHTLESFTGACGSFTAPDHEFPSYLELQLTARDAHGLTTTATRPLHPRTVELTLASDPAGAQLSLGPETEPAPYTRDVIVGSVNFVGAATPQGLGGDPFAFTRWSDGGARSHTSAVIADTTLTATFTRTFLLAGTDVKGPFFNNSAGPGEAEVYQTQDAASQSGTATELWLYVTNSSTATALVLGLYEDEGGRATRRLGSGRIENPQPDAWNKVDVHIPGIQAGRRYWIALLNPADAAGDLKWHALDDDGGTPEQESGTVGLGGLPDTWVPGRNWSGGPLSAYVVGTREGAPVGALRSTLAAVGAPSTARLKSVAAAAESCGGSNQPPLSPAPKGPVGAWGFDEARGKTARDSSGTGNAGRVAGAVRTRGRFGGGLSFDGRNDWVTVADDPSLDLTRAMTLEAWVRPAARGARSVLVKERGTRLSYGLYARPSGHVFTRAERALRGGRALRLRRWSHLAMTWDGRVMRIYVDAKQVARHALAGTAVASSGPLRIGGNAIWPEFFKGVIDEVRVYDRALSASEVVRDRDTAISPGAERPKPKTSRGGKRRRTRRAVHRGTRWLSGGGAALRSG